MKKQENSVVEENTKQSNQYMGLYISSRVEYTRINLRNLMNMIYKKENY